MKKGVRIALPRARAREPSFAGNLASRFTEEVPMQSSILFAVQGRRGDQSRGDK